MESHVFYKKKKNHVELRVFLSFEVWFVNLLRIMFEAIFIVFKAVFISAVPQPSITVTCRNV